MSLNPAATALPRFASAWSASFLWRARSGGPGPALVGADQMSGCRVPEGQVLMILGVSGGSVLEQCPRLSIGGESLGGLLRLSQQFGELALVLAQDASVGLLEGCHLHQQVLPVDGLARRGEGSGQVSGSCPARLARTEPGSREVTLVVGDRRVLACQLPADGQCLLVGTDGLGCLPGLCLDVADLLVGRRQLALEIGDRRMPGESLTRSLRILSASSWAARAFAGQAQAALGDSQPVPLVRQFLPELIDLAGGGSGRRREPSGRRSPGRTRRAASVGRPLSSATFACSFSTLANRSRISGSGDSMRCDAQRRSSGGLDDGVPIQGSGG